MKSFSAIRGMAVALLAGLTFCATAQAQEWPTRQVKMLVPYAPGGQADLVVRALADKFTQEFGQPFVVVNMPGAGGVAAINNLVSSEADGYTIGYADSGQWAINGALNPKSAFPDKDLVPVGLFGETTGVFLAVNAGLGLNSLQEVIARAKAEPGKLTYGSPGIGSIHNLIMEDFKSRMGIDILHVPYKGNAQTVPALMSGEVSMALAALATLNSPAEQGKVKILASSRDKRSPMAPQIATMGELVAPGFGHAAPEGFVVRTGTPQAIIDKLSKSMANYVKMPDVVNRFAIAGFEPLFDNTPETMAKRIKLDQEIYTRIAKNAGMTSN